MNRSLFACVVLVAMAACKDNKTPSAEAVEAPGSAEKPVEPPAAKPEPKRDPAFVQVDRDQLAALCLAYVLPRTHETPNFGALVLADGKRVPWLSVSVSEELYRTLQKKPLLAKDWRKQLAEIMEDAPDASEPKPVDLQYRLCHPTHERVIVSAVFHQSDGVHLVLTRGRKQVEKVLPATTKPDEVYAAARAQIEELVGQTITIAKHQITQGGDTQLTIDDDRWTK